MVPGRGRFRGRTSASRGPVFRHLILVGILLVGTIGAAGITGFQAPISGSTGLNSELNETTQPAVSSAEDPSVPMSTVNRTRIEMVIHHRTNEERIAQGLPPLRFDPRLGAVASYYSRRMATQDFFSHTGPEGQTYADRYRLFGINCRIPVGENHIATGAENIAFTYVATDIVVGGATKNYRGNETRIAEGIFSGWMGSSGHRDNILNEHWETMGVGVALAETPNGTRVYATQNFC